MKIKSKIVLFSCIVCIFSVLLVYFINDNLTTKKLLNEIKENSRNIAKITGKEMDQWLSIQKNSLKEMAATLVYINDFEFDNVHEYLKGQGEANVGNTYYVGFPNGAAIFGIDWRPPDDFDCTERDWYKDALSTDDVTVSSPYIDFRTGDVTITISKAIKKDGKITGVLGSDIFVNHLIEVVSSLELGENSYGFLIDGDENIITHKNEEYNPDSEKGYINIGEILNGNLKDVVRNEEKAADNIQIKDYDGEERFFFVEDMNETNWKVGVAISSDEVLKSFKESMYMTLLATIIIITISIVISVIIGNSISKPIIESVKLAGRIEDLDFTGNIEEKNMKRKDELGQISASFQSIIDNFKDFSKKMWESSEQVASSSEELTSVSQQAACASNSIATSAADIAMSSDSQLKDIFSIVSAVEEISAQVQEISANAEGINNLSQDVSHNSDEGKEKIEQVIYQMNNIVESTEKVQISLVNVNNSSQEMDNIIQVIQEVAEQTNLLALNAAIEAARAGEYGSGFAVVADEIRKLAEQVHNSTEEIYEIIKKNQNIIDEANRNMDLSKEEVDKGLITIDETKRTFMIIINSIDDISNQINNIAVAINQVAEGTESTVGSINSIEGMSREISRNIQNISASTEEQTASMEEIASASESLAQLAEELQTLISQIKM